MNFMKRRFSRIRVREVRSLIIIIETEFIRLHFRRTANIRPPKPRATQIK